MQLQNIVRMHCLVWGILARESSRPQSFHDLVKILFQTQVVSFEICVIFLKSLLSLAVDTKKFTFLQVYVHSA